MGLLLLMQACSDAPSSSAGDDDEQTTPMSLSAQAPDNATAGEGYSLTLSGDNADGPVDLLYTLSRSGSDDSSATRTITPTDGAFTDAFQVDASITGEHTIVYSAADSDDELSGQQTVLVSAPDSTMTVSVEAPTAVVANEGYTLTLTGSKADGPVEADYVLTRPELADSSFSRTLTPTAGAFTDQVEVPGRQDGTHKLSYSFSDADDAISDVVTVDVASQPAMTLGVDAPSTVTAGESYEVSFTGSNADGNVSASFTLSRSNKADSTESRTLSATAGSFSDTFSVTTQTPGQHELSYQFADSDDIISGAVTITITEPDDNPSVFTISGPDDALTGEQLTFTVSVSDPDGLDEIRISESGETTRYENLSGTDFSESFTRLFSEPQSYAISVTAFDAFGRTIQMQRSFDISRPEDNPASITLQTPSGRGSQSWSASVGDADGIAQAEFVYVLEGNTDSTRVPLDINGDQATIDVSSPSALGRYNIRLYITDGQDYNYSQQSSSEILAQLQQRELIVDAGYDAINVQIDFDFLGQSATGSTNSEGLFSASFDAPIDSVVSHVVSADALGLQEAVESAESSGDAQILINPIPVPIDVSSSLPGQYPRTSDEQDISTLVSSVDNGQNVPVTLSVVYSGSVFVINSTEGTAYSFTTSEETDPAGVIESFTLQASHQYLSVSEPVTKEVFDRRPASIMPISLDSREDIDILLEDFLSYVSSSIEIISDTLYTSDPNILDIDKNGDDYSIAPEPGFVGSAQITAEVENRDGFVAAELITVTFTAAPRVQLNVKNEATDQFVESYLLFLDENNQKLDSLASNTGEFNAKIPQGTTEVAVAQKQGSEVLSFEHARNLEMITNGHNTIPITNNRVYDLQGNETGTFSMFDMKRLRYLVKIVHGNAPVINLDGTRENVGDTPEESGFGRKLHRPTESANGMSYDFLAVPDTTDWVLFNEQGIAYPGDPELIKHLYETEIAPLMGDYATPVQLLDRLTFDHANPTPNAAYMNPRLFKDGSLGTINVLGKLPYTTQLSLAQLLSDGDRKVIGDDEKIGTILQELTAGMIYFSQLGANFGGSDGIPAQYRLGRDESIITNPSNLSVLSKFDRKVGFMIYDPDNKAGEIIVDLLRVPDAWRAEYDSL